MAASPIEPQEAQKKNTLAIISLVLGALSVAFAQFCSVPGFVSSIGCMGLVLALGAILTGILGIRGARKLEGRGKKTAIGGILTAILSFVIFFLVFIPIMLKPSGMLDHLGATPSPTPTATPTMTPTPAPLPTGTPESSVYRGKAFTITFSDEWQVDANAVAECQGPQVDCLVINHPSGIKLTIIHQVTLESIDAEILIQEVLSNFSAVSQDPASSREIEIDGRKGRLLQFAYQSRSGREHALFAAVTGENDATFFLGTLPNEATLSSYRAEIEAIILSTELTPTASAAPTATFSPTPTPPTSPSTAQQTYDTDKFQVSYTDEWQQINADTIPLCQNPDTECLILIHRVDENVQLSIVRRENADKIGLEAYDQMMWEPYQDAEGVDLLSTDEVEIDGRAGIKRIFSFPDPSSPSGKIYLYLVLVASENDLYQFGFSASTPDNLMKHQSSAETVLSSLTFSE